MENSQNPGEDICSLDDQTSLPALMDNLHLLLKFDEKLSLCLADVGDWPHTDCTVLLQCVGTGKAH